MIQPSATQSLRSEEAMHYICANCGWSQNLALLQV